MGLVNKLRSVLGGEERTFEYQCTSCKHEFTSPHADMSRVSCPDCRSKRIRGIGAE